MTVRLPDLNTWHRVHDWPAFAAAYPIAACRATMGTGEVDPYWFDFLAGCNRWGVLPIAYHRLRPAQDVAAQAAHFLRVAGPFCCYALDVESTAGAASEPTMADAAAWIRRVVEQRGRQRSHLLSYLPRWWYDAHGDDSTALGGTQLWASRYDLPIDWSGYAGFASPTLMQYADDAPITGVGVGDMNEYRGSLDELKVTLGFKLSDTDRRWLQGALA